jgi:hypothetical protein
MTRKEEMEIEITPSGKIRIHLRGIKGKHCLEAAEALEKLLGRMEEKTLTSEYYEPETPVKIAGSVRQRRDQPAPGDETA